MLVLLRTVMARVPEDDTAFVNLYGNKGAADPMLIGCALDGMQDSPPFLIVPTWIIVSKDKAVRAKAEEFDVESCMREEVASRTQHDWDSSSRHCPS